jgi:hypothetical protein
MVSISISAKTFADIANVRTSLLRARHSIENRTSVMQKIKRKQLRRWKTNFIGQGSEYGKWRALRPRTVAVRKSMGLGPTPILIRGGSLLGWVNTHNSAGVVSSQAIHWEFHGKSGGAGGASAPFHSEGYFNVPAGVYVPPRIIWNLDATDRTNAERELEEYVDTVIQKYFS